MGWLGRGEEARSCMMERTAAARDDLLTPARRNGAWRSCHHEGGTEGAGKSEEEMDGGEGWKGWGGRRWRGRVVGVRSTTW